MLISHTVTNTFFLQDPKAGHLLHRLVFIFQKNLRIVHSRSSTRFSNSFCSLLRECLEYRNSTSSTLHTEGQAFSTGVASTAAQCGVDDATVKLFERMESSAYLKFTHCPKSIPALLNAKRLSRVTKLSGLGKKLCC